MVFEDFNAEPTDDVPRMRYVLAVVSPVCYTAMSQEILTGDGGEQEYLSMLYDQFQEGKLYGRQAAVHASTGTRMQSGRLWEQILL